MSKVANSIRDPYHRWLQHYHDDLCSWIEDDEVVVGRFWTNNGDALTISRISTSPAAMCIVGNDSDGAQDAKQCAAGEPTDNAQLPVGVNKRNDQPYDPQCDASQSKQTGQPSPPYIHVIYPQCAIVVYSTTDCFRLVLSGPRLSTMARPHALPKPSLDLMLPVGGKSSDLLDATLSPKYNCQPAAAMT